MRCLVSAVFVLTMAWLLPAEDLNFRGEYWMTDSSIMRKSYIDSTGSRQDSTYRYQVPITSGQGAYRGTYLRILFNADCDSLYYWMSVVNAEYQIVEFGHPCLYYHAPDSVVWFTRTVAVAKEDTLYLVLRGGVMHMFEYECAIATPETLTSGIPSYGVTYVRPFSYYIETYDDAALLDSISHIPNLGAGIAWSTHNYMSKSSDSPYPWVGAKSTARAAAHLDWRITAQRDGVAIAFPTGPVFLQKVIVHDLSGRVLRAQTVESVVSRMRVAVPSAASLKPLLVCVVTDRGTFRRLVLGNR